MRSRLVPSSLALFIILVILVIVPVLSVGQSTTQPATQSTPNTPAATTSVPSDPPTSAASMSSATPTSAPPGVNTPTTPTTTILGQPTSDKPADKSGVTGFDPYLDVPPMPKGRVTLVGGIVRNIDRIRNSMTVDVFGGQRMRVRFDERSHIFRDGIETTGLGIKKGDRVYVDTMLDKSYIFARNVHVVTASAPADARGQLLGYPGKDGVITIQDELSSQPVRFRVDGATVIKRQGAKTSLADLRPGSLITVLFAPDRVNRGLASEVSILATPGDSFVFAGEITYLNLTGRMAVRNISDGKTYEIHFDPITMRGRDDLRVGAQVTIHATYTGHGYETREVTVAQASAQ
jgi:hypothetical protein